MAEDRQEQAARLLDAIRVTTDGLGERLVERLVEAVDVLNVVDVESAGGPLATGGARWRAGRDIQRRPP